MTLQELLQKRAALHDQQKAILDKISAEERNSPTEDEAKEFDRLDGEIKNLDQLISMAQKVEDRDEELNVPLSKIYRSAAPADYRQPPALDDAGFKNLGEFVHAVRFGDPKGRLQNLAAGQGQGGGIEVPAAFKGQFMPQFKNEWSMGVGQEGGFAVPTQFKPDMLMIQPEPSIVRDRATVIPAGDPPDGTITMPAFSQGANGVFGGVEVYWIGEGATKPETDGTLEEADPERGSGPHGGHR